MFLIFLEILTRLRCFGELIIVQNYFIRAPPCCQVVYTQRDIVTSFINYSFMKENWALSLYFPRRSKIWKEKGKRWHLITLWLSMCECSCNCRIELIKREESRTIVQKKKMVGIGKTIDTVCLNNIWLHLTFKRRCNGCIKWEIELRKPLSLGKSQRICKAVQRDARKTRKNLKYSMRSKELDYPC